MWARDAVVTAPIKKKQKKSKHDAKKILKNSPMQESVSPSVKEKCVKAASAKETALPTPRVVSNKQSGGAVVTASLSNSTVKKKRKKSKHDTTATLKNAQEDPRKRISPI